MIKTTTSDFPAYTPANSKSSRRKNYHVPVPVRVVIAVCFFSMILTLNTSFQISRSEAVQIESEYMVPGFIRDMRNVFADSGSARVVNPAGEIIGVPSQVQKFFIISGFRPAWTSMNHLNSHGAELMKLLVHAREFGLEARHYHVEAIRELSEQLGERTGRTGHLRMREDIEILLTDAALMFMVNLHQGYVQFDTSLSVNWMEKLPEILRHGMEKNRLEEQILSVQPAFIEYTRLQQATQNFVRRTELTDAWEEITEPGKDSILFMSRTKHILIKLGYLGKNSLDAEIMAALKEFQLHNGIEADGKVGENTIEALNLTSLYRYRMLALNLDRLRKQDNSHMHLLYVNIPAYRLKIFKENRLQEIFRVIVGSPKTPTPQLTSNIDRIITNPVWDVPQSIIENDIIPKIKADSGYLKRNRFKLVHKQNRSSALNENIDPDRLADNESLIGIRQEAGSDNALGRIKFIFSNPYAVYLHDTPGKTLFDNDIRALSHGCIRVQDPARLADYIVKVIQSDSIDISNLIEKGTHRDISLVSAVPIHISYITCDTDEKGSLYFYKDIYGIDQQEMGSLASYLDI